MQETFEQKLQRVLSDSIEVVPYDPTWVDHFTAERDHLLAYIPSALILRIEHFGSTAVPGLAAKPIIDVLVEVSDLEDVRKIVPPILEAQGYDYFWRAMLDDDQPPFYAWFIKRDQDGVRTHHIHMVEGDFEHWDRLLFRDYLIAHPAVAEDYQRLKYQLSEQFPDDRIAYTQGKAEFIQRVTALAKAKS